MHEVSLVAAMVEQVEEVARVQGFERVTEVRVGIGAWSGVEPSCVEFCFPEITRGTVLDGARLAIEPIAVELQCQSCGERSTPPSEMDAGAWSCAHCHSAEYRLSQGKEFKIVDLEVEGD